MSEPPAFLVIGRGSVIGAVSPVLGTTGARRARNAGAGQPAANAPREKAAAFEMTPVIGKSGKLVREWIPAGCLTVNRCPVGG